MNAIQLSVGKSALAVPSENQPSRFQVAQGKTNRNPADIESAAELMLACDRKCAFCRTAEYFLSQRDY
jgi:hypothetical protein